MARPKISEPRTRQLNLSLTESELASVEQRARALGMRPVHFGRALLLDQRRTVTSNGEAGNNKRLVYEQLSRLGNNLNQLVRHLHRTGDPLPPDLEPLLKDIRRMLARVSE
jgi:mobilization protein NikA